MPLHKSKKFYPPNFSLYPDIDKFMIWYDTETKSFRVTHYSRFSFRPLSGNRFRRNDWTYMRYFSNELEALEFAKKKASDRRMVHPTFLLKLEP